MKDKQKYAQAFASLVQNDREALAAMIVEYLDPNHITVDYVSMLLDSRSLRPGDQLIKKVRKGIEVRTLVPGAIHLASEVTLVDRANYHLSGIDVKVHINEWELESGELGSLDTIEAEMRAKISDYYINLVLTALSNLWDATNTPNNWVSAGGSITATLLENAIDEVNYRVGSVRAVVGTRKALTPITKFANYVPYNPSPTSWGVPVPSAIEEIRRTGFVGTYYGARIIALDQIWDNPDDYNALLPEDKVLVIGNNVGDFITYGDVKMKQWTDMEPTPPVFKLELYQQYGMIIDRQLGVYVIDNIS
jgi:hypothetical protein